MEEFKDLNSLDRTKLEELGTGGNVFRYGDYVLRFEISANIPDADEQFKILRELDIQVSDYQLIKLDDDWIQTNGEFENADGKLADCVIISKFIEGKSLDDLLQNNFSWEILVEVDQLFAKLLKYFLSKHIFIYNAFLRDEDYEVTKPYNKMLSDIQFINQYIYNPSAKQGERITLVDLTPRINSIHENNRIEDYAESYVAGAISQLLIAIKKNKIGFPESIKYIEDNKDILKDMDFDDVIKPLANLVNEVLEK